MNKRRLIISLVTGTIALSVLSLSFSLAWYASSDRLLVNTIDIDIKGDHDLLISTSPELDSFKESLSNEDLNQVDQFIPVSSMYKNTWMDLKSDTPIFYDTSSPNVPSSGTPLLQASNQGFYSQKLYLKANMAMDYYATLSGVDSLFKSDEAANSLRAQALKGEIKDLSEEEINEKLNDLVKCLRISILVPEEEHYGYYIIDPTKEEDEVTTYAGLLDNDGDGYFDTYPVKDENDKIIEKEVVYGEVNNRAAIKYDDPSGTTLSLSHDYNAFRNHFFGNSFTGINKETAYTYNQEQSFKAGVSYVTEESLSVADLDSYDTPLLIPLHRDEVTEITVSIYLEGWDKDCYNSTMGASFISTLSFKLLRGMN